MHIKSLALIAAGIVCVGIGAVASTRHAPRRAANVAAQGSSSNTFVIRNVRVFDGEKAIDRTSVRVQDGKIAAVGPDVAGGTGATVIDGTGRTLLPGLIDAHTHAFGDALERALVFGVTTELDMFTEHRQAAQWRSEQQSPSGAPRRADILSAGTLVTAPKGHGTQFGITIPTITSPAEAQAFVDARIAEGSDYIKIVYEDGSAYNINRPTVSEETMRAVIAAAKSRGKLALVHVGSRRAAEAAIAAGADGLVHIFADQSPSSGFAAKVRDAKAFVIPTLSVIESVAGVVGGSALAKHPALTPLLTPAERSALNASFPPRPGNATKVEFGMEATRQLAAGGVPVLAGSDAPNTGTTHGATIHRELELLVQAGLTSQQALAAATSAPARAFSLSDRGRIAPGLRADLLLVEGNPLDDITATRAIVEVWKGGVRLDRRPAATEEDMARAIASGAISNFDDGQPAAAFGAGWQISTDSMFGGTSEAKMQVVKPGAEGTAGGLEITGAIKIGAPFPWAGAMFFPAPAPMSPADLSKFKELVFWARGDGRQYQVMMFSAQLGNAPVAQAFTPAPEWREFVMPFKSFSGMTGSDVRGILFSADGTAGAFRFAIDSVRLR